MPELPEVEVVRAGIDRHVLGRTVAQVDVHESRSVRRHGPGAEDFVARVRGMHIVSIERRGKFMWLHDGSQALVIHLGMSGQVLVNTGRTEPGRHTRITMKFLRPSTTLSFDDQRMFGGMQVDQLLAASDGRVVPQCVAHIAPDPFEATFDMAAVTTTIRRRRASVKSLLLNQEIVSGIGNIYADEALWRARVHWRTPGDEISVRKVRELLTRAREVMAEALAQGGTSFDALYVNVNGQSGYFSRSLNAYGQDGEPCARCGSQIVREPFANRSSYRCPRCQRGS